VVGPPVLGETLHIKRLVRGASKTPMLKQKDEFARDSHQTFPLAPHDLPSHPPMGMDVSQARAKQ
jgi:hypothetical protein